jgi:hypothetical protein
MIDKHAENMDQYMSIKKHIWSRKKKLHIEVSKQIFTLFIMAKKKIDHIGSMHNQVVARFLYYDLKVSSYFSFHFFSSICCVRYP